jgi:hypothetical protein
VTTSNLYFKSAEELMKLIDDNLTEPNTIERRWLIERLVPKLQDITDKAADEDEAAFQVGYDEGWYEGRSQAESDYENDIMNLEDRIRELELEISNLHADNLRTDSRD